MSRQKPILRSSLLLLPCFLACGLFLILAPKAIAKTRKSDGANRGVGSSTGSALIAIRDSLTGHGLPAVIDVDGARPTSSAQVLAATRTRAQHLELPEGPHTLTVRAYGHQAIETRFQAQAGKTLPITIWLDPKSVPDELRPHVVKSKLRAGFAMLHGHIVDAVTGEPLAGVSVRENSVQATSDSRGYFLLYAPAGSGASDSLPETANLAAELSGYKTYIITSTALVEGDTHYLIALEPGTGVTGRDDTHKLMRSAEELAQSQLRPEGEGDEQSSPEPSPQADQGRAKPTGGSALLQTTALVWAPPTSIRVGFNCSCATCSTVEVMSLETYTKRGLNDEWIASWRPHSLRAGAIAYRSYGAYHVFHPRSPDYDICSTTCCQVNDADTSASTDAAVEATAGMLLERGGAVFRSEYSAENNNDNCTGPGCSNRSCTCGNGNAGSPGAGWPCVTEPWDVNRSCFGHGRGMCQWGTQRSALEGQVWNWIEDHYYNDNGNPSGSRSAFMTSPLDIADFRATPDTLTAGDTFTIDLTALNYAELAHSQVLIGASLYSPATGYLSDPLNDAKVTLDPGSNSVARFFTVPADAPSGSFDLLVALWLDIDGDNAITSADLPLVWYTLPGAVAIQ